MLRTTQSALVFCAIRCRSKLKVKNMQRWNGERTRKRIRSRGIESESEREIGLCAGNNANLSILDKYI